MRRRSRQQEQEDRATECTEGRVIDLAVAAGLTMRSRTYGAVVFDYDNDGWPDLFICGHSAPPLFLRNDRGRFRSVSPIAFPQADRHGCVAGDTTGNGKPDLFCTIGGHDGKAPKKSPNELWVQGDDGTFVDIGGHPQLADTYGRGRQAVFLDVNRNGLLDLFVANASPRQDGRRSQNRLFMNEGKGVWRAAPELGLDVELSCGSSGAGPPRGSLDAFDFDGDGWTDVLMCARTEGQDRSSQSTGLRLFRNDRGERFTDVTRDVGLSVKAADVAIADLTGDGIPDLVTVTRWGLSVYRYERDRYHLAFQKRIRFAARVAVADATGNGRPDIYVMRSIPLDFVTRAGDTRRRPSAVGLTDLLLLNRGSYDDYEVVSVPAAPVESAGKPDDVVSVDHDRDGRAAFLVLQGAGSVPAPFRLIAIQ